ncbi:MAG: branched-chain amino acid transport system ATP-binding protein [Actinomycetota bacterium]|nr:branched-chain amino acid transport system ATP-binding protein [Actinomycetota bacterium]
MRILVYSALSLPLIGAFAMFAVGIVVIYRASRVLNLAHGAMAMVPAYVAYTLAETMHLPIVPTVVVGLAAGAALGLVVERVFVRGLRHLSVTAQTVGTVAVLFLLISVAAKVWGSAPRRAATVFPAGHVSVGAGQLSFGAIGLFAVAVVLAAAMLALFQYTDLGLAMRGAAANRRAAALMGVNPDRVTALAWAIGGALAAVSGILLASITTLTPYDLPLQTLPAFVAALLGGIESLSGALWASAIVGLLLGLVPAASGVPVIGSLAGQTGGPELTLTLVAMVVMYMRGQRFSVAAQERGGLTGEARPSSRKRRSPALRAVLLILAVAWVWLPGVSYSVLANASLAITYAIVGISLVLLTGWVGQISLGHAALVGIGAFGTGVLARSFGLSFPFNLPVAALLAGLAAVALGAVALRVRGLYLAVATLIFSWMADHFLFRSSWFVGTGGSSTIPNTVFGTKGGFPNFDLSSRRVIYYFGLAILSIAVLGAANLRSSKTGRAFFAVRGSETAAASLGVDVMRYKLLAFAISGALAGAAGNLAMIDQRTVVPDDFRFTVSLLYLGIAVVGGLTSVGGVVVAAAVFAALREVFFRVDALSGYLEVVQATLLVAAILFEAHRGTLRGALAAPARRVSDWARGLPPTRAVAGAAEAAEEWIGRATEPLRQGLAAGRGRVLGVVRQLLGSAPSALDGKDDELERLVDGEDAGMAAVARLDHPLPTGRGERGVMLEGRDITVRFGGLTAVSGASLEVCQGEIVGLIGPNGAGKTTLFNALCGLNQPAEGSAWLLGRDVSGVPVHERAKMGLARTFQVLQLFGDLSVRDNLLVATHLHNSTGVLRHAVATDVAIRAEHTAHRRVADILDLLDLHGIADRPVAGLPFGTLRLVELGRAIVTGAPVVLLDEPASGLDSAETERFATLLRDLRDRTGVSMLLIEHDVAMVTGVSDYIYVLNMGELIAEGTPDLIRRDPRVVAAYLGNSAPAGETVGARG